MTLAAVQEVALAEAAAQAQGVRDAARERAEQTVAAARAETATLLAERHSAAERLADREEREQLAHARAQASVTVLSAQRTVLVQARAAARTAVGQLVDDPRYSHLQERLKADAHHRLQDDEPVRIVPAVDGGFVAYAGSRLIDYSLTALLDRCLEAMQSELERLWR